MKKIIDSTLVLLLLIFTIQINIFADGRSFYAYTDPTLLDDYSSFVKDNVSAYMNAYYENDDISHYEVGNGITINDPNDLGKMMFPIWNGDDIVATFLVVDTENGFSGVYSESYSEKLNYLADLTSVDVGAYLVVENDTIYAVIGNAWYDLNSDNYSYELQLSYTNNNLEIVNVADVISISPIVQTRVPSTYTKNFTVYYVQSGAYCYSYALGNILRNMGYTSYTPSDIQKYMNYSAGANKQDMANYLKTKGLSCAYSNSGYLSYERVTSIIFNNYSYIYIGAQRNNANEFHAFVIYGYSSNGTNRLYNVWNPWYSTKQTMDANSRIITTNSTATFIWNNGYLYDIK